MKIHKLTVAYTEAPETAMLEAADRSLLSEAWKACEMAYSPYSKFSVGAALRLANGMIFLGNNQENAAFPSGLCAERVAAFAASANQPGIAFECLAIVAKTGQFVINEPVTPCGSCCQALAEYEMLAKKPLKILLQGQPGGKIWIIEGVGNLLPFTFHGNDLKKL